MIKSQDSDEDYSPHEDEKLEEKKRRARTIWHSEEDDLLRKLVNEKGLTCWEAISEAMNANFPDTVLTAKKCRSRWKNSLDPNINKKELAEGEILLLLAHHHECKNSWNHITKQFSKRSTNLLRNTFYGLFRKFLHNIVYLRKPLVGFTPCFFIKALYLITYIMEVISLKELIETNRDIAPTYIFDLVISSKVSKPKALEYLNLLLAKLKKSYPSREGIAEICGMKDKILTQDFLDKMIEQIRTNVKPNDEECEEKALSLIGRAIKYMGKKCLDDGSAFEQNKYSINPSPLLLNESSPYETHFSIAKIPGQNPALEEASGKQIPCVLYLKISSSIPPSSLQSLPQINLLPYSSPFAASGMIQQPAPYYPPLPESFAAPKKGQL